MSKRLLFVSHSYKLEGGAEFSLLELIKESQEKSYQCHVVLPKEGTFGEALDTLGVEYSIANYKWSAQPSIGSTEINPDVGLVNADSLLEAYTTIQKFMPDIVITNTIMPPWYAYVAKSLNIPNIMMIRESFDKRNRERLLPTAPSYLEKLKGTIDFFLFNSQYTKDMYAKYLDPTPSDILYPIVRLSTADQTKLKQHATFKKDGLKIIITGSIIEHKNQLEAVKALNRLIEKGYKNITLTIMGSVDKKGYIKTIKKYITEHHLAKYIVIKPFSETPLEEVIKHEIVITPSLTEAFGRVTLEGQLVGRLVIGCNGGGTKELIEHQRTGLLYEGGDENSLADQILWALEHKEKAIAVAQQGQKFAINNFLTRAVTLPFFRALDNPALKKEEQGNIHYDPLIALIQRNFHVNSILNTYAESLSNAIQTIEKLQTSYGAKIDRIRVKAKYKIKKLANL